MPGILDRGEQGADALKTSRKYGREIADMPLTDQQAAQADLLPEFEKAVDVEALNKWNEKVRRWIDKRLGLTP